MSKSCQALFALAANNVSKITLACVTSIGSVPGQQLRRLAFGHACQHCPY
jgi:hypothetical protein